MINIAAEAAELRDTETSIDKALTKLERFLSTLSNLAVEVSLLHAVIIGASHCRL